MNHELARLLLDMEAEDNETRTRLVADGRLFRGYAPEMERVHRANAAKLERLLDRHGWPGRSFVGEDGCRAAWIVAQHAIGLPTFQRRCLRLIQDAVDRGEAAAVHAAYLEDRIAFNEGVPQRYGTCLDWERGGRLGPGPLRDPEQVDERRRRVGLPPLAQAVREAEEGAIQEGAGPPADFEARQRLLEAWARQVGWR